MKRTGFWLSILEDEKSYESRSMRECDGCGRDIPFGEKFICGIESCCGGGCSRSLCFDCVERAYELVVASRAKEAK